MSHHKTLTKEFIKSLYDQRKIKIRKTFEIEIELYVQEYLGHAQQSKESKRKICNLLEIGLGDPEISKYFISDTPSARAGGIFAQKGSCSCPLSSFSWCST